MADLTKEEITLLADKKLRGTITPEENASLEAWLSGQPEKQVYWHTDADEDALRERLFRRILFSAKTDGKRQGRVLLKYVGRVAAVLVLALGLVFYLRKDSGKKETAVATVRKDVQPGRNGALLTLADGRTVSLDSTASGMVAIQDNYRVVLKDGGLQYEQKEDSTMQHNNNIAFNTVSTPRGRQFAFTLSDGTRVWLNAGSSIQYPVAFAGSREVTITGEAYFEVAKIADGTGKRVPFIVKTNKQQVEVLGTHFDVNAYTDEPSAKTTLLEGRVRVSVAGMAPVQLAPGQQSVLNPGSSMIKVKTVDAEAVAAWTRGMFSFTNAGIEEVMRQFARWYNVRVVYAAGLPGRTFSGKIYRNLTASQALDALKFMNLNFDLETSADGVLIRVMP